MGRRALHSEEQILDAAQTLVLNRGARSLTVDAIASFGKVPKGSIYHRYASLNDLLAAMWIRAARSSQGMFLDALADPDPLCAAVNGALALHDFASDQFANARLLASMRREDLIEQVKSPVLRDELSELNRGLELALRRLAGRVFGANTRDALERTVCAVVDIPMGAIRRHLITGTRMPKTLRSQLELAVRGALSEDTRR